MEMWNEELEMGPARSPHRQHDAKTRKRSRGEAAGVQEKGLQAEGAASAKLRRQGYAWCAVVIVQVLRKQ